MAERVRVELQGGGILALLRSEEIAELCEAQARRMTLATGMEYKADVYQGKTRVNAAGYQKEKNGPWSSSLF